MLGKFTSRRAWLLLLGLGTCTAYAETGYVTDILSLGLHRAPDTSDGAFRTLRSGDEFEVLSRNGYYAQVRLPDGTTGYVKAGFIVTDKPARLIVDETAAERDALAAQLADLKAAFAEPAARLDALTAEAASLKKERDAAQARAADLEAANAALVLRQEQYRYSLPYSWVAGAALLCLLGGLLAGLWWVDRQNRRRHGGIRVM
jgi:SH3 domain protein